MRARRGPLLRLVSAFLAAFLLSVPAGANMPSPVLSARSAIVIDARNGGVLYSKNPRLRLPPASTAKVMTAIIAIQRLPLDKKIRISRNAYNVTPSKAGLTQGREYLMRDLLIATLVASSNDAAVALAEAAAGSEDEFAALMNAKAREFGMKDTRFVNATGLPDRARKRKQYSTAYDLTSLMREASKDRRLDWIMGLTRASFTGSDGKRIEVKSHNKMLFRMPKFVKGKTGWTRASRHTFVGTDYPPQKKILFAMLSSSEPWSDIERLASFGLDRNSRTA
jgi:D-alanyl-D-alanine carboxypeptidase (penicillin-binding protein 5/6)